MKRILFYTILKDKSVSVVIETENNFIVSSYKQLLKLYPKAKYEYIKRK